MEEIVVKKNFIPLLSIVIILMSSIPCSALEAESSEQEICNFESVEFIFTNENIDDELAEKIINAFSKQSSESTTYGILCNLFGHKYESSEELTVITHKAYDSAPRCLRQIYDCSACSRCDFVEKTFVAEARIYCF